MSDHCASTDPPNCCLLPPRARRKFNIDQKKLAPDEHTIYSCAVRLQELFQQQYAEDVKPLIPAAKARGGGAAAAAAAGGGAAAGADRLVSSCGVLLKSALKALLLHDRCKEVFYPPMKWSTCAVGGRQRFSHSVVANPLWL